MKWSETYRINTHDCDAEGIVRASLTLRYMQETANLQMKNQHPSNEELRERDMAFLLSRICMRIYVPLYAGDGITVTTWACESRGVSYNRCYRICRGNEVTAEAAAVWGLVGISDRRLIRVGEVDFGFAVDEPLDIPTRVRIPHDRTLSLVGERQIVYSNLDVNRHMNNTNYPDMLCDFLPDMESKRVKEMSVSFANEAKFGEVLKVYTAKADDDEVSEEEYLFRTIRKDGLTNIEAVVKLETI